jgi:His-Xaa-Ser system protein HxsD
MNHTPATLDVSGGAAKLHVDATLYPLDALYGAAYVFIDRCFVFLERAQAGTIVVTLSPKKGTPSEDTLRALAGEFGNELLSCAWRQQITEANRAQISAVTNQAIAGALGPPSLEQLANFDFTDAPLEDPLGIAQSWEEKYKKKDKDKVKAP